MLIHIAEVFSAEEAAQMRRRLQEADWVDGRATAGHQSAQVKRNRQLPEQHPLAQELGNQILQRLSANNLFMSAALPRKIFPPLFNRYEGGEAFGYHVDNAVRAVPGSSERVRTDLSATLFFSDPASYDGGELVVDDTYGPRAVKLPAGHMVLYPGTSLHKVNPVTRGARISAFFWMQSLVREDSQRALLLDMDVAIQRLNQDAAGHPSIVQLTGVYHNLLRRWAEV
ncbi:Fe2+-dependent dioxygenase [Bordetella petrii]|uniref:Fe2+-dependent dioxygenase n=1 Tax=Bordetella petrii TaxID=94624 RepID=UPI00047A6298|nr:Fe2+-dependent dioxygenase [Bordetella petrii]